MPFSTLALSFFFFFSSRRRHTRSLCDWSSDVCSSDLLPAFESTSRHWREERDFLGARDRRTGLDVGSVDGCADELGVFKRERIFLATSGKPGHEVCNRRDAGRRIHDFLSPPDALAHPGEIQKFHTHSSIRCRTPPRT